MIFWPAITNFLFSNKNSSLSKTQLKNDINIFADKQRGNLSDNYVDLKSYADNWLQCPGHDVQQCKVIIFRNKVHSKVVQGNSSQLFRYDIHWEEMQGNSIQLYRHNINCPVVQGNSSQLSGYNIHCKAVQVNSSQLARYNFHCQVVQGNSVQITRLSSRRYF